MFCNNLIELFCNLDIKYTIVEFNPMCNLMLCWQISQNCIFFPKLNHHLFVSYLIPLVSIRFDSVWWWECSTYTKLIHLNDEIYVKIPCPRLPNHFHFKNRRLFISLYVYMFVLAKLKKKLFESFALILNAKICFWINHAHVFKSWIFGKWNLLHTFGFV